MSNSRAAIPTSEESSPRGPQSLNDLLRRPPHETVGNNEPVTQATSSSHSNHHLEANGSDLPRRDERRWSGFHLWRTESEHAKRERRAREAQEADEREATRLSMLRRLIATIRSSLRRLGSSAGLGRIGSLYREDSFADLNAERLLSTPDGDLALYSAATTEPLLSTLGLIALTISLAGAQLAWTLELAYGTPYLLSLGLSEQSTSLVWLAGPLSGLIAQPIIGSLSDASSSRFRRRKYMMLSAAFLIVSTLALAFSAPLSTLLVDLFGGGLGNWDPKRNEYVHTTTQWISVLAFWILDFALNGLQAASRALILDIAPSQQQSLANAWHGRMTHAGNVVGYLCGWLDLASWKGLRWIGGGQFRRFAMVSLFGMLSCVFVTVGSIEEKDSSPARHSAAGKVGMTQQLRDTISDVWQAIRRLPRPVRRICVVQLFAFMGWFPFLFYGTTYILQMAQAQQNEPSCMLTFQHTPHFQPPPVGQPCLAETGDDTKAEKGSFAMLMFALVSLTSGAFLPYLSLTTERQGTIELETPTDQAHPNRATTASLFNELPSDDAEAGLLTNRQPPELRLVGRMRRGFRYGLTLRTFWTLASLLFSLLMVGTFFVQTVNQATVLIALVGIPWSVATWAPFAMVGEFVREAEQGESPFEFENDHWSPKLTRARARARRQIVSESQEREQQVRDQIRSSLVDCQPIAGQSSPTFSRSKPLRHRTSIGTGTGTETEEEEDNLDWYRRHHVDDGKTSGGTILGIHNLAIVAPQFLVAIISSLIFSAVNGKKKEKHQDRSVLVEFGFTLLARANDHHNRAQGVTWVLRFGGAMALFAAIATRFIPLTATERLVRGRNSFLSSLPHRLCHAGEGDTDGDDDVIHHSTSTSVLDETVS